MTKRPKVLLPIFLVISFVLVVIGILMLINLQKRKTLQKENTQETEVSQDTSSGLLDDFPVYPEAVIESSYTTEGDKKATSVVWKTGASLSQVSDFYKSELENAGWAITSSIENEDSTSFSFERDTKFGIIGIGRGEGGLTVISVTIGSR